MAFSRAILWVSSSQTGWRVFPKNRSSPILWLLSLLFTGSEKLRCFSEDPWSISFFSDSLWTSTVSLRHIAIHKTISYCCWITTSAINVYNWCARPFKIDIWWVDPKMINTIISDTFDKCLYWSFSVGGYVVLDLYFHACQGRDVTWTQHTSRLWPRPSVDILFY